MILSYSKIDEIATAVMKDFNQFFFKETSHREKAFPQGTPIDQFASEYLGLKVSFIHLSDDGNLCGLTAYEDTEYIFEENGKIRSIPLKRNEVLLDRSFIEPGNVKMLCGKRRFTLAHECAHQILFQLESDEQKASCRKLYAERRPYSLRDLKTNEDWNEWQANALGAAILMPKDEIDLAIWNFSLSRVIKNYAGIFAYRDRVSLKIMCDIFKVSKSAMIIRLRQLGYLKDYPRSEYIDPLEVWA